MSKGISKVLVASMLCLVTIGVAVPALAKDGDVERSGACSGRSDWKMKLSEENGAIEVEYEVDQNKVGDVWRVRIRRDGNLVFRDACQAANNALAFVAASVYQADVIGVK